MFDQSSYTAQDALDLVIEDQAPLNFGSGMPVYRAAIKRLSKLHVPSLITYDLSAVPMTCSFVETVFERWDEMGSTSKKERASRSQLKSRLLTIARRLEGVPVVRTTKGWEDLLDAVKKLADERGLDEQALIPITSTLRAAAVKDDLEPSDLSQDWLSTTAKASGTKRRDSLKKAVPILNGLWADLPEHLRPQSPFGAIETGSRRRKSLPLPPRVSEDLEDYLAGRVLGTTAEGFFGIVTTEPGINEGESTNIYRQAVGWHYDSLCVAGQLEPEADIRLVDLARLDWVGDVAFGALKDANSDKGEDTVFPWNPITPETIYNRVSALNKMFGALFPTYCRQQKELHDPTASISEKLTPDQLLKILNKHFKKEMTDAHRGFCRGIIQDQDQQRLFLNMHMICWSEAQTRWKTYDDQGHHQKMQTINLCVLATILGIVVNIPFRARTVTSMVLEGDHRDLSLPKGQKRIEFHIAPEQMKVPKRFDAILEDTKQNRPRQILDWFIAGPRRELLRNTSLLRADNARPDLLFCGIGRARYNQVLSSWSEDVGLRMTTHMFRHALASILINCCGCPLEEAARMLGNTVAVTERQYAFQDLMRRRGDTLRKLEGYRAELTDTHHPGRKGKRKS